MPKHSWYEEPVDPNEHKWGKCTWCPLRFGHTGSCLRDDFINKKTSRRAAVAAATSMKTIKPSFKNGTLVRHQFTDGIYYYGNIIKFDRVNATYKVQFNDGDVFDDMKANELEVVPTEQPTQPGVEAGKVEVEVDKVAEVEVDDGHSCKQVSSPPIPTIEELLNSARLSTYIDTMIHYGWDDVEFLRIKIREWKDFNDLDSFPIIKPGHRMRLLSFLHPHESQM
jgi:hypothetical protein